MENNTAPALNIVKTATQSVQENLKDLKKHQGIGYRVLSILLSFVFFAFYSKLLFTVFMANEGFFSYDMLLHGNIGLNTFFITTEMIVVLAALLTTGAIIPVSMFIRNQGKNKESPKEYYKLDQTFTVIIFLVSIIFNLISIKVLYKIASSSPEMYMGTFSFFMGISACISLYIFSVFCLSPKYGFLGLLLILMFVGTGTIFLQREASNLFQFGLYYFGIGGNIPVEVQMKSNSNGTTIEGNLVFLSPQNIYLSQEDTSEKITIIPTERTEYITVKSRPKTAKKDTPPLSSKPENPGQQEANQ